MTARVLPVDEWPRLANTTLGELWPTLNPQFAEVLVVEQDGQIVGSLALLTALHAECLSLHGGPGVAKALWQLLAERVREAGGSVVWGAAVDDRMTRLLSRHAQPIPGDHFLLRVS